MNAAPVPAPAPTAPATANLSPAEAAGLGADAPPPLVPVDPADLPGVPDGPAPPPMALARARAALPFVAAGELPGRLRANPARLGLATGDPFAGARAAMIDSQLRPNDVTDPAVLAAMAAVPRERFVPPHRAAMAYADRQVPLDEWASSARALNNPLATARLIVAAQAVPGDRALVLGSATGYAAALLAAMGLEVVAHEDDDRLAGHGVDVLADHAPAVRPARGERALMLADDRLAGLFDRILIDGAVEVLPDGLAALLVPGGRLVTGLVDGAVTRLARAVAVGGRLAPVPFADLGCARLPAFAAKPAFQF